MFPANIWLFKVNNRNTIERCDMLKGNTKDTRMSYSRISGVFIVKTLNMFSVVSLLFIWTYFTPFSSISIVDSEQVNIC